MKNDVLIPVKKEVKKSEEISAAFYKALGPSVIDGRAYRRKDDLRIVKKICKKQHAILDLGCGIGRIMIPLVLDGYDVRGIDISLSLVGEAKRRLIENDIDPSIVKKGSMLKIPYRKDSFDRVICLWTAFNELLEKEEQLIALNEMKRVLRPGGMAFIDLVNGERSDIKKTLAARGTGWQKKVAGGTIDGIQHHCFFHDRKSLKVVCSLSKFDSYEIKFMNFDHQRRIVAFLKKDLSQRE